MPNADRITKGDDLEVNTSQADIRRKSFEASQEAARNKFERDTEAEERRVNRNHELHERAAKKEATIAERRQRNLEQAFVHGYLNDADLANRLHAMAPPHDCMTPEDARLEGEGTVLMAFSRDVILTLSASDVRRLKGIPEGDVSNDTVAQGSVTHGARVLFRKGYEDVPESLADHSYLRDAGAFRVNDEGEPETEEARDQRLKKDTKTDKAKAA